MGLLDQFLAPQQQMAGQGLLAQIFSQGDRAKRYLTDLLSDPAGSINRTVGQIGDSQRVMSELSDKAMAGDRKAAGDAGEMALSSLMGFAPAGMIAYHGSPHIFNKFDSSKIGTGEGAQAYGHGLYLSETPEVAKQYAGALSAARATKTVGNVDLTQAYQNMPTDIPETLLAARRDFRTLKDMGELSPADKRDFLAAVKNNITAAQGGALYKVDLPDSAVARMLDWDKPLAEQPANVAEMFNRSGMYDEMSGHLGSDIWKRLIEKQVTPLKSWPQDGGWVAHKKAAPARAADQLRSLGIPGIRYLDGGSRWAGDGSRNMVIFPGEENLLTILERNGIPLGAR